MDWKTAKDQLLEDPATREAYFARSWDNFTYWLERQKLNLLIWWEKKRGRL